MLEVMVDGSYTISHLLTDTRVVESVNIASLRAVLPAQEIKAVEAVIFIELISGDALTVICAVFIDAAARVHGTVTIVHTALINV